MSHPRDVAEVLHHSYQVKYCLSGLLSRSVIVIQLI